METNPTPAKDESGMSDEMIKALRSKLPDGWKWSKCYEMEYINRGGRNVIRKHWALTAKDEKGCVCSLGLISHDNYSTYEEFTKNDFAVQFVERSLEIVDTLQSLLASQSSQLDELRKELKEARFKLDAANSLFDELLQSKIQPIGLEDMVVNLRYQIKSFLTRTDKNEKI